MEPRFPYVVVDVDAEHAEDAAVELFELGAQGVEERDATTLVKGAGGLVTLVASFASHDEAREAKQALPSAWAARVEEVIGDAWRDEWKKHFHAFEICPGVVIRPPWEASAAPPEVGRVLELEPGRAFGTGLHETTSLVAALLYEHRSELAGARVLDLGCGSGILALVALALGAAGARAIDVDADAVAVTQENAARNGLSPRVQADTTDVAALTESFPVVVANIEARVLVPMAQAIAARVAPRGLLVVSGILGTQRDEVRAAYAAMHLETESAKGEWVTLALRAAQPNEKA